jgi:hypothetical protein
VVRVFAYHRPLTRHAIANAREKQVAQRNVGCFPDAQLGPMDEPEVRQETTSEPVNPSKLEIFVDAEGAGYLVVGVTALSSALMNKSAIVTQPKMPP